MSITVYNLPLDSHHLPDDGQVVALGLFDGLHIGHRAVIAHATALAARQEIACSVYTFQPGTITTKPEEDQLCTPEEQQALLDGMGVHRLYRSDFATVRELSPAEFVEQVLVGQLHATAVVCGFNYRFGYKGAGDIATLEQLCTPRGISVHPVQAVTVDNEPVSSTRIRRAIAVGDMGLARRLLGRPIRLTGVVRHGQGLGRTLGFPTVNLPLPTGLVTPRFGVYATCVEVDGRLYTGVTNIGRRPTVGGDTPLAETFIDGLDEDLYGCTLSVYPVSFLRQEQKFDTLNALKAQVQADAAAARALFATPEKPMVKAILFDFDDTLGPRIDAYQRAVSAFLHRYYPTISAEKHQQRLLEMCLCNNFGYGMPMTYGEYIRKFLTTWAPFPDVDPEQAATAFYEDFAGMYDLYDDTVAVLTTLRRQGYQLGIITNGAAQTQNRKLDKTGVRCLVDIALVSGDEGVQKPDAALFHRAAARLGVPPACCVYVGDHPLNDVQGALNAGMQAVWMDPGFPPEHPSHQYAISPEIPTIHTLSELPALPMLVDGPRT